MRALVERISFQNKHARLLEWGRLISVTGSAQALIQGLTFLSGILVIRLLPTEEYAFYTLANTMLGTMLILADGGITPGVLSEAGKVWEDPKKFGSVIVTGFGLRRKFTIISLMVAMPTLFYLLINHGASIKMAIIIIVSVTPSFFTYLAGSLLEIAPKLKQEIVPIQKVQVISSFARLGLLCTCLLSLPFTFVAILCAGMPQIYANLQLKKISKGLADFSQKPNKEVEKSIIKLIKRVFPGSVYYCFSAQVSLWLISVFGSTAAIAHIGALGRLGMILTVVTIMFNTLIVPRFARLTEEYNVILKRFLQLELGLLIWSAFTVLIFWVFSSQVLWILGPQYANLNVEVVLSIVATCLSLISGITYSLFTSRGWAINPFLSIVINIGTLVLGAVIFDMSSLQGILILNIVISAVQVLMNVIYCFTKIRKLKVVVPSSVVN